MTAQTYNTWRKFVKRAYATSACATLLCAFMAGAIDNTYVSYTRQKEPISGHTFVYGVKGIFVYITKTQYIFAHYCHIALAISVFVLAICLLMGLKFPIEDGKS